MQTKRWNESQQLAKILTVPSSCRRWLVVAVPRWWNPRVFFPHCPTCDLHADPRVRRLIPSIVIASLKMWARQRAKAFVQISITGSDPFLLRTDGMRRCWEPGEAYWSSSRKSELMTSENLILIDVSSTTKSKLIPSKASAELFLPPATPIS